MPNALSCWRSLSQKGCCLQEKQGFLRKPNQQLHSPEAQSLKLFSFSDHGHSVGRKVVKDCRLCRFSYPRYKCDHHKPLSDYDLYRRSVCGDLAYRALLVDAAGTLIVPAQPAAKVYYDLGQKYGIKLSEAEILRNYRRAYSQPWHQTRLRFKDDARPFWHYIVKQSTDIDESAYSEELYQYYTTAEAWRMVDPYARNVFVALRSAGVKLAVVSNFDTRLRSILMALSCYDWFDALAVSAEVGAEKPNPTIFLTACEMLKVKPEEVVHVGDDRRNDLWGARDAGCDALLWGQDVTSFAEVAHIIGVESV